MKYFEPLKIQGAGGALAYGAGLGFTTALLYGAAFSAYAIARVGARLLLLRGASAPPPKSVFLDSPGAWVVRTRISPGMGRARVTTP